MKKIFFFIGMVLFFMLRCKKEDKSIACETDQECTEIIYGMWEEDKSAVYKKRERLEFDNQSKYKEYFTSDGGKNYQIIIDSAAFFIKNKELYVYYLNYPDTFRINKINILNFTILQLDDQKYKKVP